MMNYELIDKCQSISSMLNADSIVVELKHFFNAAPKCLISSFMPKIHDPPEINSLTKFFDSYVRYFGLSQRATL